MITRTYWTNPRTTTGSVDETDDIARTPRSTREPIRLSEW